MISGLEVWGVVLLPMALAACVGLWTESAVLGSRRYSAVVGVVAVAVAGRYLYAYPPSADAGLTADVGVVLVFAGGLVLLSWDWIAAGRRIRRTERVVP